MNLNAVFRWRSLRTRVTLFTLLIFVIGLWSLAFYSSRMLRDDMRSLLGEQQFSTVSILAAEINHELSDRIEALEMVAATAGPAMLRNPADLQALLNQRPVLQNLFSGGVIALRPDGTAIADVPLAAGRIGVNYMHVDTVATALKEGKASIGRPVMGAKLKAPVFGMAVPIRDTQGKVIGALSGVTNLGKPGFLDRLTQSHYGKTGGYMLVARQHRLVVTATDKRLIMNALPAPGNIPLIDRFIGGYEGSGIAVNPLGVEILGAAKGVPVADWYVAVALPTTEAFAPIRAVQQRVLLAALLLTVLAGALTWWMLSRELSPLLATVKTLATLPDTNQPPQALPITRQDEIGQLIGGFNRLLETLAQRDIALRESEERLNEAQHIAHLGNWTMDLVSNEIVWTDELFRLLEIEPNPTNATYEAFLNAIHPDDRDAAKQTYTRALKTRMPSEITHRLRMRDGRIKWVHEKFVVSSGAGGKPLRAQGTVQDVTARKHSEDQRLADARQQRDTLVREVHHRIKNNLQSVAGLLQRELGKFIELDQRLEAAISQVSAIAVVHGLQSANPNETIRLCDSVRNICKTVSDLSRRSVVFAIEHELTGFQPVQIDSNEGVPVALVLNELILNAVKHSPPGGGAPTVSLSTDGASARLVIRNALDAAPGFSIDTGEGLGTGLRLVRSLLPNQGAQLNFETDREGFMLTTLKLTSPVVATILPKEAG